MTDGTDVCGLIQRGGVYADVEGSTPEEVYKNLCAMIPLPAGLSAEEVEHELLEREAVLSTAVGSGIAIPHPRRPIVPSESEERVVVCFPRAPLNMQVPDDRQVYVMFLLLTHSTQSHIRVLSDLARLFRAAAFKKALETRPTLPALLEAIKAAQSAASR